MTKSAYAAFRSINDFKLMSPKHFKPSDTGNRSFSSTSISSKSYLIHLIVLCITIACFLMNGPMRGGLPLNNTLEERIMFIANNGLLWSLSWCVWMFSALGLLLFCIILADELQHTFLRTFGLLTVAIGIAPDLIAEVLYAFVIPDMIQRDLDLQLIEIFEIIASHLTGFLGNGLYNIGGMLLTSLAIKQGLLKPWIAIWGLVAWTLGLLLSLSIAMGSMAAAEFFTASSMVLSTLWMLIFAHKVLPR